MKLYIKLLTIISLALATTACDNDFEEINTDPNHATEDNMDYSYLFTSAQIGTAGNNPNIGNDAEFAYEDWRNSLIYSSTMIQHLASTYGYWNGDKYTYNAGYNSAYWEVNYPRAIKNIVDVINNLEGSEEDANFYHIARIFKAYMFQRMTDMYGDCPYFEAGLGYADGISQPAYDTQEDIYNDLFLELQDAAESLDATTGSAIGGADLIYGGDVAQWKKFAYSEMLRLAMRLVKVNPTLGEQWARVAVEGGVMTSNNDNALVSHQNQYDLTANGNATILAYLDPNTYRVSNTLVSMLKELQDPRLIYMTTVAENPSIPWGSSGYEYGDTTYAAQLGMPNGYDNLGSTNDISNAPNWPGDIDQYSVVNRYTFARLDAPTFLLTYAETTLLMAEAAQRGWIAGDAATYYNEGVTAAMEQLTQTGASPGVSSGQISTYLSQNPYNATTGLEQINTQYWLVTFMDEYEAWANWRRSGYPELTPVDYPLNVTNGTIPRRFTYPVSESADNSANYVEAVSRMADGDAMTSRVWWDTEM